MESAHSLKTINLEMTKIIKKIIYWLIYLGGRIEFNISSVCWRFFESSGWSFLVDDGLAKGIELSIGVGEDDFKALA